MLRMRQRALRRIADARVLRAERFAALQRAFRSSWEDMRTQHRVVIHLPGAAPATTLADSRPDAGDGPTGRPLPTARALETCQLPRISDTADPLTDVVFVVAKPLPADVEEYWARLLEAGGVAAPATARFTVVHAEGAPRLPQRMPLAAKILASRGAMRRLAAVTRGRAAFIVPGGICDADVELAVALGVPLLGATPAVAAAVSAKSGARVLLSQAHVNVPPGVAISAAEGPMAWDVPVDTVATGENARPDAAAGAAEAGEVMLPGVREGTAPRPGAGSTVKLTFSLEEGKLQVAEAPPRPPPRHERKDRQLCECIAAAMLQPGTKHTKVRRRGPKPHPVLRVAAACRCRRKLAELAELATAPIARTGSCGREPSRASVAVGGAKRPRVWRCWHTSAWKLEV